MLLITSINGSWQGINFCWLFVVIVCGYFVIIIVVVLDRQVNCFRWIEWNGSCGGRSTVSGRCCSWCSLFVLVFVSDWRIPININSSIIIIALLFIMFSSWPINWSPGISNDTCSWFPNSIFCTFREMSVRNSGLGCCPLFYDSRRRRGRRSDTLSRDLRWFGNSIKRRIDMCYIRNLRVHSVSCRWWYTWCTRRPRRRRWVMSCLNVRFLFFFFSFSRRITFRIFIFRVFVVGSNCMNWITMIKRCCRRRSMTVTVVRICLLIFLVLGWWQWWGW